MISQASEESTSFEFDTEGAEPASREGKNRRLSFDEVRPHTFGRWPALLNKLCPVPIDGSGKHGPCPKCGGTDRFRALPDFQDTGAVFCNQCRGKADGFAVIAWLNDVSPKKALSLVADELQIDRGTKPPKSSPSKSTKAPKADADAHLEFMPWPEPMAALWCLRKSPITPKAMLECGARFAAYRKRNQVFALPITGKAGATVGWCLYHSTGKELPIFEKGNKSPIGSVKIKVTTGSQAGWMGPASKDSDNFVWKVEGPSDMQALLSLGLPDGHTVVCNAFGAGENPSSNPWMLDRFKGKTAYVIHDCDQPGQEGAIGKTENGRFRPGWANAIASVATECRNVVLPYTVTESHGKDLRDWIQDRQAEGLTNQEIYLRLLELAKRSTPATPHAIEPRTVEIASVDEADAYHPDDPLRLAKIQLESFQADGSDLAYWRVDWYRYTRSTNAWTEYDDVEFDAWLNKGIEAEFMRLWRVEFAEYDAWVKSDKYDPSKDKGPPKKRKVNEALTKNVWKSLRALVIIPTSAEVPYDRFSIEQEKGNRLSFRNGTIRLDLVLAGQETGYFEPASPRYFTPATIPYDFDPNARCDRWHEFLDVVMQRDRELIEALQKFIGYCLTPGNRQQKWMALEGSGGNGKSTFLKALRATLGDCNISDLAIEDFGDKFSLASTIGKLVNLSADCGEIEKVSEGLIKRFVGGDVLQAEKKFKDKKSFKPTAKLIVAWNTRPRVKDRTDGFWRKILIIPFNVKFTEKTTIVGMDDEAFWETEAPGIMNWAIVGLHMLQTQKQFDIPKASEDAIADYKADSNPMLEFLSEHLEDDQDECVIAAELYLTYRKWCERNGYQPTSSRTFGKEVFRIFPDCRKDRPSRKSIRNRSVVSVQSDLFTLDHTLDGDANPEERVYVYVGLKYKESQKNNF